MTTAAQIRSINSKNGSISRTMRNSLNAMVDMVFNTPEAIVATADGLTTGLISADTSFASVTSSNATFQISLPAAEIGKILHIYVGATGCELISSVAADTVNAVIVGATNEAAIPADTQLICTKVAADTWLMTAYNTVGAVVTAIIPDALV